MGCCQVVSPVKDPTTVTMYWEPTVTMHADASFNEQRRATLLLAAEKIRIFTQDRARIDIKFDLDFNSQSNLMNHVMRADNTIRDVEPWSTVAQGIDARHPLSVVNAETATWKDGHASVVFIPLRYDRKFDLDIAMHELGHMIGFDDLKTRGDVMSGGTWKTDAPAEQFTAADLAECRRVHLCD